MLKYFAHVPHGYKSCEDATHEETGEGHTSPPQLLFSKHIQHCVPSPGVVQKQSLQLEHGAHGQEQVEHLMTLAHKVTAAGEETLRNWTGEEEGSQNEWANLQGVKGEGGLLWPGDGEQTVGYGANI